MTVISYSADELEEKVYTENPENGPPQKKEYGSVREQKPELQYQEEDQQQQVETVYLVESRIDQKEKEGYAREDDGD